MLNRRALSFVTAAWIAFASAAASAGPDDDDYYDGETDYMWNGEFGKPFKTPDAACRAGRKDLYGKKTFVAVKPGSDAVHYTCVYREASDNSTFTSDDNVQKASICHNGAQPNHEHAGRLECVYTKDESCRKYPPKEYAQVDKVGDENRCKPDSSHKAADMKRAQRRADKARAAAPQRWIDCYEQARAEIAAEEVADKPQNGGVAYPDFVEADLYPDGKNRVNIGLLCGDREKDKAAANNIAGYDKAPILNEGKKNEVRYVWHHTDELGEMVLVREDTHQKNPHKGGVSIWKRYLGGNY